MRDLVFTDYDILVVDDEADNLDAFRFAFRKSFRLHYAAGGQEALDQLAPLDPAVIVADQRMPGMSGIELLRACKERSPDCYAVLLTAYADVDVLVDAVNSGAVDRYVQKPWDSKELAAVLRQGIDVHATVRENRRLREQLRAYAGYLERQQQDPIDFGALLGGAASPALLERLATAAPASSPVLIEGEEGVEKDVVARALHVGSAREGRPFVAVRAAAFAGEGLERELFGWRRGSFDGAFDDRAGRFELADGGTLWLADPTELSPPLQARLLRLLVDGEVERVGEPSGRRVDVRLIVSAAPTLAERFAAAPLLPELASRLSVLPIFLPPLRERRDQVRALAEHFLRKHGQTSGGAAASISGEAMTALLAYDWPGNVRELENAIERAAILSRGGHIGLAELSFGPAPVALEGRAPAPPSAALDERLEAMERRELIRALEAHRGNKAEVARALGIQRTTLYYRLKKHGIDV